MHSIIRCLKLWKLKEAESMCAASWGFYKMLKVYTQSQTQKRSLSLFVVIMDLIMCSARAQIMVWKHDYKPLFVPKSDNQAIGLTGKSYNKDADYVEF